MRCTNQKSMPTPVRHIHFLVMISWGGSTSDLCTSCAYLAQFLVSFWVYTLQFCSLRNPFYQKTHSVGICMWPKSSHTRLNCRYSNQFSSRIITPSGIKLKFIKIQNDSSVYSKRPWLWFVLHVQKLLRGAQIRSLVYSPLDMGFWLFLWIVSF